MTVTEQVQPVCCSYEKECSHKTAGVRPQSVNVDAYAQSSYADIAPEYMTRVMLIAEVYRLRTKIDRAIQAAKGGK